MRSPLPKTSALVYIIAVLPPVSLHKAVMGITNSIKWSPRAEFHTHLARARQKASEKIQIQIHHKV